MRAPLHASASDCPLPKVRHCHDRSWSPPRADDPDRPRLVHDDLFALSISAPHPVAARLVVGPDDVRDVGVGNERYDAVAPSLNGVGSEIYGGHSNPPRAPSESPYVRIRRQPLKIAYAFLTLLEFL